MLCLPWWKWLESSQAQDVPLENIAYTSMHETYLLAQALCVPLDRVGSTCVVDCYLVKDDACQHVSSCVVIHVRAAFCEEG